MNWKQGVNLMSKVQMAINTDSTDNSNNVDILHTKAIRLNTMSIEL